jgi:hypothetical protein
MECTDMDDKDREITVYFNADIPMKSLARARGK